MGETLGRFELLGQIAKGGMAEILMARQRGMEGFEKLLVVKRLLPELAAQPEIVQLFLNEARIAARLSHPNVIQIYDLGKEGESFYIAMEYIQGEDLRKVLKNCAERDRLLPLHHTLETVRQVCEGLQYAHTKTDAAGQPLDIVHCDISPQNVLVSFDGVAKVVDFGIARAAAALEQSDPGRVRGKHGYMSPEQCRGKKLDGRSDLFSLGVVLWELSTGRRLFKRISPLETVKAIVSGAVVSPRKYNPKVSEELEGVIMRALDTDPERRFQTALQMGMALDKVLKGLGEESGAMQLGIFLRRLFKDKLERLQLIEEATARGEEVSQEWFREEDSDSDSPAIDSLPPPVTIPPPLDDAQEKAGGSGRGRRRLAWLVVGLLGLVGLVVLGFVLAPRLEGLFAEEVKPPPRDGQVVVRAEPVGAEVYLDETLKCKAPCEVPGLKAGRRYTLRVEAPGHHAFESTFTLATGELVRRFELQLKRAPGLGIGRIEIITTPPGATVELDGKRLAGVTPLTMMQVSAGRKHILRAWVQDNRVWMTTFRLRRGQKMVLRGVLPQGEPDKPKDPKPVPEAGLPPGEQIPK